MITRRRKKLGNKTTIEEAFHLRALNYTYQQIADKLNITPLQAHSFIIRKLKILEKDFPMAVKNVLYLELERLDEMQRSLWNKIQKGDIVAINAAIKIMERRAKLLGLDVPEKIETTMQLKTYVGISLEDWEIEKRKQIKLSAIQGNEEKLIEQNGEQSNE